MYLQKLEIQGFKSFADKLTFQFNEGMTAVVGPNGSGKSNVADAVRWVLGEQSAKTLRGSKMEDIIFAGTENRKPLGFAQVSLTIDNSTHLLPIEFEEVVVTRRVYRSGESEYFINRAPCRLRDIHELFMDTGIGKEGYSIIGQGQIDKILSTKPEDRRQLFEEAVGIVKYKNRKQEAEKKLDEQKQNLIRVDDIIGEIENQLSPLQEQAESAQKYLEHQEQLKTIEANIFLEETQIISQECEKTGMSIDAINSQILQYQEQQDYTKNQENQKQEEIQILEQKLEDCRMEIKNIQGTIEENVLQEKIQEQKQEHCIQDIQRLNKENEQISFKIKEKREEKQKYQVQSQGLQLQLKSKNQILAKDEKKLGDMIAAMSSNEDQVEQLKIDMIEALNYLSEVKSKRERVETVTEHIQQRCEYVEKSKNALLSRLHHKNLQKNALIKQIEETKFSLQSLEKRKSYLEHLKAEKMNRIENYKKKYSTAQEEFHKLQSRSKLLSEMTKEYEGFYRSVKTILSLKKQDPSQWKDIHGVLADLITVPEGYEIAYEIALGSNVQNIVTETEEIAKEAIAYLKKNQLGRATFLPLQAIRSQGLGAEKAKILKHKEVLGMASDLVTYDPIYKDIITQLLGRIIIVSDLEQAVYLAKKLQYRYRIVTLEGDLLNPGGSLTGGSIATKNNSVFSRTRQLKDAKKKLAQLETQLKEITEIIDEEETMLQQNQAELATINDEYQKISILEVERSGQIDAIKSQIDTLLEEKNTFEIEETQLKEQSQDAFNLLEVEKNNQIRIEKQLQDLEESIEKQQDYLQVDRSAKEELSQAINRLQIEISIIQENKRSMENNIQRLQEELSQLDNEKEQCLMAIQQKTEYLKDSKIKIQDLLEQRQKIQIRLKEKETEEKKWDTDRKNTEVERHQLQQQIQEKIQQQTLLQKELFRLENVQAKLEMERNTLYDRMWNDYELTYGSAQKYRQKLGPLSFLREESQKLKQYLKSLGPINLRAIEEFENLQERYSFLSKQKEDIVEAEKALYQIIHKLTSAMEEQFMQEFQKISKHFHEVFQELFGGGTAYVELVDPENVLESGIQIIAQPPGKKLQNMMLLSGGERALTAIALLFSILKIKPSPFCILDEIEAALDDANVSRFAQYLKKFTADTQFIVITHRKGTMEVADTLYGITMQERGISTLVSVKLSEVI
ncbi:MAG: chromosome segregation protein SMC [Epulopiscium sp.]|nr:chromosome segregation protein SMC [Candidatus Epulonipiscium sp.]